MERPTSPTPEEAVDHLVDRYRSICLWFVREDWYPRTPAERLRALDWIERYGDVEAFRLTAEVRRWLSPDSSAPSAACSPSAG